MIIFAFSFCLCRRNDLSVILHVGFGCLARHKSDYDNSRILDRFIGIPDVVFVPLIALKISINKEQNAYQRLEASISSYIMGVVLRAELCVATEPSNRTLLSLSLMLLQSPLLLFLMPHLPLPLLLTSRLFLTSPLHSELRLPLRLQLQLLFPSH